MTINASFKAQEWHQLLRSPMLASMAITAAGRVGRCAQAPTATARGSRHLSNRPWLGSRPGSHASSADTFVDRHLGPTRLVRQRLFPRPQISSALRFSRSRNRFLSSLVATVLTIGFGSATESKTALLVVGNTTLDPSDAAIEQRLDHYYKTTVRDDSATADTTKDLIVISQSADFNTVGTKYKAVGKGILVLEPALFDDMAMTAAGAFGTFAGQTRIMINDAGHQMAAGFARDELVTIYGSARDVGWGTPTASGLNVALAADGVPGPAVIFHYRAGATMSGGFTAPARRVGYFVKHADALTAGGWKMFDYAVDYADGEVPPIAGGSKNAITWSSTVTRLAGGCDAYSPTWAPDNRLYTSWGDCNGLTGALSPKRSMGLGRISGLPWHNNIGVEDIDTGPAGAPDIDQIDGGLDALGQGPAGEKPSGMLYLSNKLYTLVRNIQTNGTQSALRYTGQNYYQPNSSWNWAGWTFTEFGYPVFVQYGQAFAGGGAYVYVVAHDNPSAYVAADRFILMRAPVASILDQSTWQFFSGTAAAPAWSSFAERARRTAIFSSKGRCLRNGMTYNAARKRYYWWQQIPPPSIPSIPAFSVGLGSTAHPSPGAHGSRSTIPRSGISRRVSGASSRRCGWTGPASIPPARCT